MHGGQVKTIEKNGCSFLVKGNETLYHGAPFWDVVQNNRWEPETFKIIEKFCSKHHAFIDMGAWIGPTTLFGACIANQVYAVEPDPVAIAALKENMALNKELAAKITLFEGCISDSTGSMAIGNQTQFGNSETSLLYPNAGRRHTVNSLTFPDFVSRYGIQHCSLVKMDVEGAEIFILPSMIDFLKQSKPTVFISFHRPMYGERGDEFLEIAFDILSGLYNNVYAVEGRKIQEIRAVKDAFFDLIATELAW